MPKQMTDLLHGQPLLDIASYARRGPGRKDRLSPAEVAQIARTVGRTPEVMVKVLSKGGQSAGAVQRHLDYIGRGGEVEIETDDGKQLEGKGIEKSLLNDWDLDLDTHRRRSDLSARNGRAQTKLVQKLIFSMPAGTPPDKVLAATRKFAREQFAMKHRYAMALHTDEPHPHVHLVLKAVSEQGVRLNIKKATLRHWRSQFASHLRGLGVAANATERAVRGESRNAKKDGIYRASLRGESTYMRVQTEAVAAALTSGVIRAELGKRAQLETRNSVSRGWHAVADILSVQGDHRLAAAVIWFADSMVRPLTDRELLTRSLQAGSRSQPRQSKVI